MLLKNLSKFFVVLEGICIFAQAETGDEAACRQGFFKKLEKGHGLSEDGVLASHVVSSWFDCSSLCLEEQKICVFFSYSSELIESESNCHLYGQDLKQDLDLSEDLVSYAGGKEELWEMYKFVDIESEICLKQQVCQNGASCLMDSCEPEGYRCACDRMHYGKRCEHEINDFDLVFPPKEEKNESYIFVKDAIQSDFNEFTFTTWFKTNIGLKQYRLFAYILEDVPLIELWFETEKYGDSPLIQLFNGLKFKDNNNGSSFQPVNDNVWHHVAFTWSKEGDWTVFIDGKHFAIRKFSPSVISKGGVIYIGKVPGMNVLENDTGFIGELSRLHLWDRALSGEEIERMALTPTNDAGNIISWFKLVDYIIGNVTMIKPSTAVNTDKELNFQINFPAVGDHNLLSYISWPVSRALKVLSVCFWLRTKLHSVYISHESEVGSEYYFAYGVDNNSYMFAVLNGFKIQSTLCDQTIANRNWHFHCMTWNGKSGEFRFYYDGYIFGKKITEGKLRTVLPKAGNISVGSKWANSDDPHLNDSIYGEIAYLNVWSVALAVNAVKAMSAGGLNINGDVMAWRDVQRWIVGNLDVIEGASVYFPGYTVLKRRSEWCDENKNSTCCPLYARLGGNKNGNGMRWRCYCASVLVGSKFTYDLKKKGSGIFSGHLRLLKIK